MYVTASLQLDASILTDKDVRLGVCYPVAQQHIPLCGTRIQVIAGPHADFGMKQDVSLVCVNGRHPCPQDQTVYTIELLDPPPLCELPFLIAGGYQHLNTSPSK